MQVTPEDIRFVSQLVDQLCGVMLDETKGYLVESRLGQLAREHGCASYRELCLRARANSDRGLQQKIIDAITTQETLFFRDSNPFDALQNRVLPGPDRRLHHQRRPPACGSGRRRAARARSRTAWR